MTFSIQSTTLPFSSSWIAICVIAVAGDAPCQCFSPGGQETTSPGRMTRIGPPGEQVAKDMIAVRIGPDMRMAVVGAPSYFAKRSAPKTPQDLTEHNCISLRLPTYGGLYAWEFEKGGRELKVRVEGQLVLNSTGQMLEAALAGFGLAYVPEDAAQPHLEKGALKRALEDWCPPYSGYHLYYPSRRQPSAAFALLVEALRYRD